MVEGTYKSQTDRSNRTNLVVLELSSNTQYSQINKIITLAKLCLKPAECPTIMPTTGDNIYISLSRSPGSSKLSLTFPQP